MTLRYGPDSHAFAQAIEYRQNLNINGVAVSFHPAGHILGSAQIRLEADGKIIVVSGDYKRERDPTCEGFEPVPCHIFITEATFGLPVFHHSRAAIEIAKLTASLKLFPERAHLVGAYALGKAQRVMALLREAGYERPIYIHGAMEKLTDFYLRGGLDLGEIRKVSETDRAKLKGEIVICPPSALADPWSRKFPEPVVCFASGWMGIRAHARKRGIELPLIISDHADWDGLCATILDSRCEQVFVTHGESDALVHWARGAGIAAEPLHLLGAREADREWVRDESIM
jgi:putative mRNA 3-end processing factor